WQGGAHGVEAIPWRGWLRRALRDLPGRPDPDIDPEAHSPRADASLAPSLFGLAPGGVCRAACVAAGAVRSYRTVSPLPLMPPERDAASGGLFSVALSLGLTPAGRYPAPYVHGARTFLSGHLSALTRATVQPTDPLGMGCGRTHVKPAPQRCGGGGGYAEPCLLAPGWASRAAMRSFNVACVDASRLPSTPCGRKWRWNAATTSRVAASR